MMMSDLPLDLLEEILSRVPAITLSRLSYTCKQWNVLIKDRRFTEKHFRKAAKESLLFMLKEYRVFPMSVNVNVAPPSIGFKGALGLNKSHSSSEQVDIAEVSHCDGLLLCVTKDYRLMVWNPCLGITRWIQLEIGCMSTMKNSKFALGYHNNKSCRAYKILRCCNDKDYKTDNRVVEFEIYDFSSSSWRVLNDVNPNSFELGYVGVSLKHNTYWLALYETEVCIIRFDFTTERFKHSCLPFSQDDAITALSVVREEKLSVLYRRFHTSNMEIWVTNKINDDQSSLLWSKSFTVDGSDHYYHVYSSLLIDEEKKLALCCDLGFETSWNMVYTIGVDSEYYSEIPYMESTNNPWRQRNPFEGSTNKLWCPLIFNYVPSLVYI